MKVLPIEPFEAIKYNGIAKDLKAFLPKDHRYSYFTTIDIDGENVIQFRNGWTLARGEYLIVQDDFDIEILSQGEFDEKYKVVENKKFRIQK